MRLHLQIRTFPAGSCPFLFLPFYPPSIMTEFLSPGDPLPHIPDDLTLPQFILDSTHECRPIRPQGATWLVEDTTGRKVGLDEVTILPAACASVRV
jgi:hypothetical protein